LMVMLAEACAAWKGRRKRIEARTRVPCRTCLDV
jgi:hypothetical protein